MKKFKGFTLLELIIVMAILAILMTAIIQLFKPIRDTYIDSTLYESQRTTQNGVVQYIGESIRFSTDLGIYNGSGMTADNAVNSFTTKYLTTYSVDPAKKNDVEKAIKENAQIIVIDNNNNYQFNGRTYKGRLLRRKIPGNNSTVVDPNADDLLKDANRDFWRLALGSAYYGERDYTIKLGKIDPSDASEPDTAIETGNASDGIKITVSSVLGGMANAGSGKKTQLISNTGFVVCKNLETPINGIFDIDSSHFDAGNVTAASTKTYIVFLTRDEKVKIQAFE